MSKKKSLLKNTIIIFIGKVFTQFVTFLLLPLYTAYLSNSDYGIVDLINTYISLFVPIVTIQLEMATFRFLVDARKNSERETLILSNVINIVLKLTFVFSIIAIIVLEFIKIRYSYLILINIIVTIFSNLFLQVARGFGKTNCYAIGSCIIGITTVILNVIAVVILKTGVPGILLSMIIAHLLAIAYLYVKLNLRKYIHLKLKNEVLIKELLKYSIPLVPNGISWWIFNVSDRTIISLMIDVSANGIYAVSNKFSAVYIGLFNIFNFSWIESASKNIDDKDREIYFSDIINMSIKIFASIAILIIAIIPFIFKYLVSVSFSEAYLYIPILLSASLINVAASLYSGIYIALKKTKEVMNTSIVSAIINILINIIFIKIIGLYAACISTLISYLVIVIYRYFDLKKDINIKYNWTSIGIILGILILTIITYYINNLILNIVWLIIVIVILFILNKDIIKLLKNAKFINLTKLKKTI